MMMLRLISAHEQYSSHEGGRGHIQAAGGPLGAAMGGAPRGCCRSAASDARLAELAAAAVDAEREAVAKKRAGDVDGAREALRRARALRATIDAAAAAAELEEEEEEEEEAKEAKEATADAADALLAAEHGASDDDVVVASRKKKIEALDAECLALKRDALAKKREGDIDGARASLRAAKAKAAEAEATRDAAT